MPCQRTKNELQVGMQVGWGIGSPSSFPLPTGQGFPASKFHTGKNSPHSLPRGIPTRSGNPALIIFWGIPVLRWEWRFPTLFTSLAARRQNKNAIFIYTK